MTAWSYSSLSTFKQCPKKYYHLKVAKDVKDVGSSAMYYGNEVHKAAEDYIKTNTPIPAKFNYIKKTLDSLNNIEGEKHCEIRMALPKTVTLISLLGSLPKTFGGGVLSTC